jgi:deazaflavin-dependent oxidoreductase (nitroreductase family)
MNKIMRKRFGVRLMTSPTVIKWVSRLHVLCYRLTGGRLGGRMLGAPVLLLTTTGRKTGQPRTTPLIYLRDGETLVVVASNAGRDNDPAWWQNLKAKAQARVLVGWKAGAVVAEQADPQQRQRLWPLLCQIYPEYKSYQRGTQREIPVVLLRPALTPAL